MGRKYYCDFCDKAFADNATNRRNHNKGVHHQRLRNQHYSSHRDAATLYADEVKKIPCRNFFARGECKFGAACTFSHYNPEELQNILKLSQTRPVKSEQRNANKRPGQSLDSWITNWKKRKNNSESLDIDTSNGQCKYDDSTSKEVFLPSYTVPASLQGVVSLPPSLMPPPQDALKDLVLEDWG